MRIAVATLATIAALPVLINSMSDNEPAPVAAVPGGANLADPLRSGGGSAPSTAPPTIGPQRSNLPRATSPSQPPVLEIAVPASDPATTTKGLASYRRLSRSNRATPPCVTPAVPVGTEVKVENLDNGHEITCLVIANDALPNGWLISIDTTAFLELGDPVQTPLPVRITW